jgi:5'/3'-nucleotidase
MEPSYHAEDGTDFAAIDADTISVTPLHFDLTDLGSMEQLKGWDLSSLIGDTTPASP